ncbi:MAG: type II secretion system protein [Candidatus Saccharimonadales bacterium]
MLKKLKSSNKGFTIIEVLIVLAIAGLIILIVLLAVPALQRNQRNTSRKNDATRIAGAITNFESANSGSLPTTTADLTTVTNDAGNLSQFTSLTNSTSEPAATGAATSDTFYVSDTGVAYSAPRATGNVLILDENQKCGDPSALPTRAGTGRQAALLYTLETPSGNWNWACVDI